MFNDKKRYYRSPLPKTKRPKYDGVLMSHSEYSRWKKPYYGGYKYEWNNGKLEATEKMKKEEVYIVQYLQATFSKTNYFAVGGILMPEVRCFFPAIDKERIPDLSYFSAEQIKAMRKGQDVVPEFVIEIISKNDTINLLETKLNEYLSVGVRCIWLIFPELKKVRVITNPKNMINYTDDEVFTASPVMPEFELSVNKLFAQ